MPGIQTLTELQKILKKNTRQKTAPAYYVPSVWITPTLEEPVKAVPVNPNGFFLNAVDSILSQPAAAPVTSLGTGGDWSQKAVVYNLFVRLGTAFDHNQDGAINPQANGEGLRETGTFLKSIALLPYIKALGADTIHLLPVTDHGEDGQKGNLGSPYAIRDPYKLDEALSEPFYNFGVENEFKAFVEAAHHLGMAVVLEFVFRTASKDCAWAKKHPEWFYWIRSDVADRPAGSADDNFYGAPIFDENALKDIRSRVAACDFNSTLPPSQKYRNFFTSPPPAKTVRKEGAQWVGRIHDGTKVRIPGAFADWPPDDNQPPWGDVTYLKMFDHPQFNYIAYNTLRMYDTALAKPEFVNRALWKEIEDIIPFYQKSFEIDGVMIDMGHALPHELFKEMVRRAREVNPNFAFWEESFGPTAASRKNGFNISVGYLWCDILVPQKLFELLERCGKEGLPLPFFGTGETHDTPRTAAQPGGIEFSKYSWKLACMLPVVPYIHGGFELGEPEPINTGLGFSNETAQRYPPEKLALFSATALNWLSDHSIAAEVQKWARVRSKHREVLSKTSPEAFKILSKGDVFEFAREGENVSIRVKVNPAEQKIEAEIP